MNKEQRKRFRSGGWEVGTVGDLFELTRAEEALIETKLKLGGIVRALRQRSRLSQAELAKRMGSTQPRVAKIESEDPKASIDLQLKAIYAARPRAQQEFAALMRRWAVPIERAPATTRGAGTLRRNRSALKELPPRLGRGTKTTSQKPLNAARLYDKRTR
jgi:transcriptional regulator with XRE-family HTH domain